MRPRSGGRTGPARVASGSPSPAEMADLKNLNPVRVVRRVSFQPKWISILEKVVLHSTKRKLESKENDPPHPSTPPLLSNWVSPGTRRGLLRGARRTARGDRGRTCKYFDPPVVGDRRYA